MPPRRRELAWAARSLADQAFSRAAGAPLVEGNSVRVLRDARENYPAWLEAIAGAREHVHLEMYIIHEDTVGERFADALLESAARGVRVRVIHDWLGALGKTSGAFWARLRAGGVDVRCYNPPRLDVPFGWLSRDHRKMLAIDGDTGFVTGLCIGRMWAGIPERDLAPWRDTGIVVRGPAVADIERAFADIWAMLGPPIPEEELPTRAAIAPQGTVNLRIIASEPAVAGVLRVDQLVTALARQRVWLTDAYYAGTALYVEALRAAAQQGVDVRLLVPGATDLPLLRPLSRAGYRPLLEAGVRVFEWNGTMLHAKTAVADGAWARVGSTNLNIASWLGNCELDVAIEDANVAQEMEAMYLEDLHNATEIVLDARRRVRAPGAARPAPLRSRSGRGSAGRAAAGAVRIGNALGAAFTNRRELEPVEGRMMAMGGAALLAAAILFLLFPALLVYPAVILLGWIALALLYRGYTLRRKTPRRPPPS
jgi:cardiolipin synthase